MLRSLRTRWFYAALLLALPLFARCGCEGEAPNSATREIVSDPESLLFNATEGQEQTLRVRISSRAGFVLVDSIKIVGGNAHFSLVPSSVPKLPNELEQGKGFTLEVKYKAPAGTPPTGKIRIESDANIPRDGTLEIPLIATSNQHLLSFNPEPVDFGSMKQGESKELKVVGKNRGRGVLKIKTIVWDSKSSPGFTFPNGQPKAPMDVEPGKTFEFTVKYSPTARNPDLGFMSFTCEGNCVPGKPDPYILNFQGSIAAPTIQVNPTVLNFGFVLAGTAKRLPVRITNTGSAVLKIAKISVKPGSSGAFQVPSISNVEIQPKQSRELFVEYRPLTGARHQGAVWIESNDPNRKRVEVSMLGQLSAPNIQLRPKKLNFGKVGGSKTLAVNISNLGDKPLVIKSITPAPGTSNEFSIKQQPKTNIPPGQSTTMSVTYKPANKGIDGGKFVIESNDPDEPKVELIMEGEGSSEKVCDMVATPSTINFGLGLLGKSKTQQVTWTNQGLVECTVSRMYTETDSGFPPYTGPNVFVLPSLPKQCQTNGGFCNPPLKVKPGAFFKTQIAFSPIVEKQATPFGGAAFTGRMDVITSGTPKIRSVSLVGTATKSCVEAVPDNLDFGLITVGCSSRNESIELFNTCRTDFKVTKFGFQNPPGANGFRIAQAPRVPVTVPAGKSVLIKLAFKATGQQAQKAVFAIEHTVTQQSPTLVPLTAKGTTDANQTDTFNQLKSPKVDILFVIDDSGSMGNEQKSLGSNFGSFIKWAKQLSVDFQIGVTTTDVDGGGIGGGGKTPGGLRGTPTIMTKQTPNLEQTFQRNALVGTRGSASERGLEAARLALSKPNITTGPNKGFLRADASLSIIIITDEPDSSSQPIPYYVNFFTNIKGPRNIDLLRVNAVMGYDPVTKKNQCPGNGQAQASSRGRYLGVVKATKGIAASICDRNWSKTLSQIGAVTFGLKKQFFLSRAADPKTVTVKINGKPVAAGPNTWTYSATDNSIVFKTAPVAGSQIQVAYKAICF